MYSNINYSNISKIINIIFFIAFNNCIKNSICAILLSLSKICIKIDIIVIIQINFHYQILLYYSKNKKKFFFWHNNNFYYLFIFVLNDQRKGVLSSSSRYMYSIRHKTTSTYALFVVQLQQRSQIYYSSIHRIHSLTIICFNKSTQTTLI